MTYGAFSSVAPLRVVVIGGGFTGAALVIHAIRANDRPLDIVVVEPAAELGRGIAYGTDDPAHRINVPSDRMGLFQDDPTGATRWFFEHGVLPDAGSDDGQGNFYAPRHVYGSFVGDMLRQTLAAAGERVRFRHVRAAATSIARQGQGWIASLSDGARIEADLVALCFGHAAPLIPALIEADVKSDPKFAPDPWARDALAAIAPSDSVLVVGTGLTMADVVVSLREKGHLGPITAASRRKLLPRQHGLFLDAIDIFDGQPPPKTALGLVRLLRRRIRSEGPVKGWHPIVDALRAKLPLAWNALPPNEKARALRRLLPFWEVHRFRIAPQVNAVLVRDRQAGDLVVKQAGLTHLARRDGRFVATLRQPGNRTEDCAFDAVVLCTGPEKDLRANPLVAALLAAGIARLDDANLGLAVNQRSRVLDQVGLPWPNLLAFGPMTRGSFGEMTGAPDIARHIEALSGGLFDEITATKGIHS